MTHSILLQQSHGREVKLHVEPLAMSEITKNKGLLSFLFKKGIYTTEDFLEAIPYKSVISTFTSKTYHVHALTELYDKIAVGFLQKSYTATVAQLLKRLRDLNLRLTENDRSIIGTCVMFKNVIKDKWQFLKKCLSKKTKRRITTREHKWEIIFQEYIN